MYPTFVIDFNQFFVNNLLKLNRMTAHLLLEIQYLNKEELNSDGTEHFILSQFARIKDGEILLGVGKSLYQKNSYKLIQYTLFDETLNGFESYFASYKLTFTLRHILI